MSDNDATYISTWRGAYIDRCAKEAAKRFDRYLVSCGPGRPNGLAKCESPIEKLFLAEAMLRGWDTSDQWAWRECWDALRKLTGSDTPVWGSIFTHGEYGELVSQVPVTVEGRSVRIDVAVRVNVTFEDRYQWIAVELDGHDFHERTKEQARRDRSRDRLLQRAGWMVVRFTGSEVHRDVTACWDELEEQVHQLYTRRPTEAAK